MSEFDDGLFTLSRVIREGLDARLKELHTALPASIVDFNAVKQTATVQLNVKRIFREFKGNDQNEVAEDLPPLINVPVQFPRGGGFSLTFPVKPGDECLIVFCERTIDEWHRDGGSRKPTSTRFHSYTDATAIVGLSSLPNKVPNYDSENVVLKKDDDSALIRINTDSSIDIDADSNVNVDSSANVVIKAASNCDITCSTMNINATTCNINAQTNITGNTTVAGTLTNNGTNVGSTHTHPQGSDSDGNSQQNTGSPQ